jgi:hypothetical protein
MPTPDLRIVLARTAAFQAAIHVGYSRSDAAEYSASVVAYERRKIRVAVARERRIAERRAEVFGVERGTD